MEIFNSFYGWVVFHYIYLPLLYPFISWWTLSLFHVLAIVNNATRNNGMYVSFRISIFVFFEHTPRGRTVGSCGSTIFSLFRNCDTFPQWLYQFTFNSVQGFPFLHILTKMYILECGWLHNCMHLITQDQTALKSYAFHFM